MCRFLTSVYSRAKCAQMVLLRMLTWCSLAVVVVRAATSPKRDMKDGINQSISQLAPLANQSGKKLYEKAERSPMQDAHAVHGPFTPLIRDQPATHVGGIKVVCGL